MDSWGTKTTKNLPHHGYQLEGARVTHAVKDSIGVLARHEDTLVTQNGQMLGNVALRSTDRVNNVLDAHFFRPDDAEDLQAQGMGNRLQRPGSNFNLVLPLHDGYIHTEVTPILK